LIVHHIVIAFVHASGKIWDKREEEREGERRGEEGGGGKI
jgi:hypothetical protein